VKSSVLWHYVDLLADTDVLEEYAAFIFRVEAWRVRNRLGYICRLERKWSPRPTEGDENMEPGLRIKNGQEEYGPFRVT
jgi:hypothetical protein